MCEVKILMSPEFQKLAQFTNVYPMGHSEIFRIPRENDVVVTDPPIFRRGGFHEPNSRLCFHALVRFGLIGCNCELRGGAADVSDHQPVPPHRAPQ